MNKIITREQAANLIDDEATIVISGAGETLLPDYILEYIEQQYLDTGSPSGLTLYYNVIPGAQRPMSGIDRFAHKGMIKKVISGSYYTLNIHEINKMINANKIEAYLVPYGSLNYILRATAAKQPGILTEIGLHTFIDPRYGGGKLNSITTKDYAKLLTVNNQEYIFYDSIKLDVAIIRATSADEHGNLSIEYEPSSLGILHQAMATKANGGIVIAQVMRVVENGVTHPKQVTIPGIFVDYVVVDEAQMEEQPYNPAWTGDVKLRSTDQHIMKLDIHKAILRRAAYEVKENKLINLGFGLSASLPDVLEEEKMLNKAIFSIEHGPIGGKPNTKGNFGMSTNMSSIMEVDDIFSFYNAGYLDMTFLSFSEIDQSGSVNASSINGKYNLGGFIDITHSTPFIVFCGTFTAGKQDINIENKKVKINESGKFKKFVKELKQVTFNGAEALRKSQRVIYITERAVFELRQTGLTLIEVAPGLDIEEDIIQSMEFRPQICENVKTMDEHIFSLQKLYVKGGINNE